MAYQPSIGDVVLVCNLAWSAYINFRGAPSEFREITSDCRRMHDILREVDQQRREQWAPMNRSRQSKAAMADCVLDCRTTLQQLDDKLSRLKSLGTATPDAVERIRYMATEWQPLRERLDKITRRRRTVDHWTNDIVGLVYQKLQELSLDIKAGRKTSTVTSSTYNDHDDDDDTWAMVARELYLEGVPADALEARKDEFEPYIQEMRIEGAFNEDIPGDQDHTELTPEDSVSISESPSPAECQISTDRYLRMFGGGPIEEFSRGTIFNSSITTGGVRLSHGFDV